MKARTTIIDYGLGNLFSVRRALEHLGSDVEIASEPGQILAAERLVLPGVGAFGDGMRQLRERGILKPLIGAAQNGTPLLGICLGMQLLFSESEEFGLNQGLDLIAGRVVRMADRTPAGERVKIPHYGWDRLATNPTGRSWENTILNGLEESDSVYFVHSFAAQPADPSVASAHVMFGGGRYVAAVEKNNVYGCQFHPEKSGDTGLLILKNFLEKSRVMVATAKGDSHG